MRERKDRGGREGEREINVRGIHWLTASCTWPNQGLNPKFRHVARMGNCQHFHVWDIPINSATQPKQDLKFPYIISIMIYFSLERIIFMANQTWECFRIPDTIRKVLFKILLYPCFLCNNSQKMRTKKKVTCHAKYPSS